MNQRVDTDNFSVEINRNESLLNAEIRYHTALKSTQYYFYLVKDGIVIDRKGWFTEHTYQWRLQETGEYFVQGYVRNGDERELRQSNKITYVAVKQPVMDEAAADPSLPAKISIFGSCTSRDLFRLYPSKDLELCSYVARQSVVSAVSEPVPLELDEINLSSAFQKTAVWRDFNKTTFDLFRNDGSKWLIIDLIDERYSPVRVRKSLEERSSMTVESCPISQGSQGENRIKRYVDRFVKKIMKINDSDRLDKMLPLFRNQKIYVTKSTMAVEAGVISPDLKGSARRWNGRDFIVDGVSLRRYVIRFAEKVLEIYSPDHIIIHRALTVDQYWNKEGTLCHFSKHEQAMGKLINDIIIYMYDILKECIPEAHEIDCISRYHGSELHHWGKATVHYEDGYYAEVMNRVRTIVVGENQGIF